MHPTLSIFTTLLHYHSFYHHSSDAGSGAWYCFSFTQCFTLCFALCLEHLAGGSNAHLMAQLTEWTDLTALKLTRRISRVAPERQGLQTFCATRLGGSQGAELEPVFHRCKEESKK